MTTTNDRIGVAAAQRLLLEKIADLRNASTGVLAAQSATTPPAFAAAMCVNATAEYCESQGETALADMYASVGVLIMAVLRDQMQEV